MSITKLYLTTYPNRPNGSGENRAIPGHGRAKPSPVFISARRGLRARAHDGSKLAKCGSRDVSTIIN